MTEQEPARMFPIQAQRGAKPHPLLIPWGVAELAYSVYAGLYGRSQSLQRLADRGGFGPGEMDEFLPDWRERCDELRKWQQYAAYCRCCAQSGESGVMDFGAFVASLEYHGATGAAQ